jgi:hypothetical protein
MRIGSTRRRRSGMSRRSVGVAFVTLATKASSLSAVGSWWSETTVVPVAAVGPYRGVDGQGGAKPRGVSSSASSGGAVGRRSPRRVQVAGDHS